MGEEEPFLEKIRGEALAGAVPIIRDETAALLRLFLLLKRPKRVLELGAAVGYSALFMAGFLPEGGRILTVESCPRRAEEARANIAGSPFSDRIDLFEGDAGELLSSLSERGEKFPFIFLDAAKAQYPVWLPMLLRLLTEGGILLSDNVLLDGEIAKSRFEIPRRDRTIYRRMREYLFSITHSRQLRTAVLPVGDGLSVSLNCPEAAEPASSPIRAGVSLSERKREGEGRGGRAPGEGMREAEGQLYLQRGRDRERGKGRE